MYDISAFIDFCMHQMETLDSAGTKFPIIQKGQRRPELPYGIVGALNAPASKTYQAGDYVSSTDMDNKNVSRVKQIVRKSIFSFNFIGSPDSEDARTRASEFYDLLFKEITRNWFRGRSEVLTIQSDVQTRYPIFNDFIDTRYGVDIMIKDIHDITETVEYIDNITFENNKTGDIQYIGEVEQ